jgi:ribosomal protein S18 acetylase RimI-like enzyme
MNRPLSPIIDFSAATPSGVSFRALQGSDCSTLVRLHAEIVAFLEDRNLYIGKDSQYFEDRLCGSLSDSTLIIGAYLEQEMIGYSSVRIIDSTLFLSAARRHSLLPLDPMIALMEDAGVHPSCRGRGIQVSLNREKKRLCMEGGLNQCIAIVDAMNAPSLRNLLSEDFKVCGWLELSNGLRRLVLSIKFSQSSWEPTERQWAVSDWEALDVECLCGNVITLDNTQDRGSPMKFIIQTPI